MTTDDAPEAAPLPNRFAVYSDREYAATALSVAASTDIAVIIRDRSDAPQIQAALGDHRQATVLVDPGRWRREFATPQRVMDLPAAGLTTMGLREWAESHRAASTVDGVFAPSLFVRAGEWESLRALREALAPAVGPDNSMIGLIATDASMLGTSMISRFLDELAPLRGSQLGFVFAGGREALADRHRLAGLRALFDQHPGAHLLGVDALIASDALCVDAGIVAVGIRSGMRWPARPGTTSNTAFARGYVPGRFHRDLLTYRSPVVYGHWYIDSVPTACVVCGNPPDRYVPSEQGTQDIIGHNVHAVAQLCADLLSVPSLDRHQWLSSVRVEAAESYRDLDQAQIAAPIDRTLVALIRRDRPGWMAPAPVGS
ncbi:hypothetical protein [Mycolicibacterium llatzerense]|uniref:Uncharacterized protein n=1 Tax=Mycolicibacterium llatzerense TaxID=280871 RepID=A0A0D1LNU7_9MYCO|nr:hypothetical protein [Mycolicibacterium llatzerense]KIU17676.1 hypothetical protein TL10_07095 [Mycolicibacterium llatzerense]